MRTCPCRSTKRTFCAIFTDTEAGGVAATYDGSHNMSEARLAMVADIVAEKNIV